MLKSSTLFCKMPSIITQQPVLKVILVATSFFIIDKQTFETYPVILIFNKKHPEFSGIVFSVPKEGNTQEAIFYIADAYHLQLQADLVVLSSCESGIGKLSKSE